MYAAAARYRRRSYARRPDRRRTLRHPVISIGNIAVGGRAKTPLAAYVASRLLAFGERPAILSRGYGRRDARGDVVVVRDPEGIRADLDRAGDEPLMLARQLDGVAVLVSTSRYRAGRVAEEQFGCTIHVLDDGFQHFDLARAADLVAIAPEDLHGRTLPSGRLREPLDAAAAADALVALDDVDLRALAAGRPVWRARRVATGPESLLQNHYAGGAGRGIPSAPAGASLVTGVLGAEDVVGKPGDRTRHGDFAMQPETPGVQTATLAFAGIANPDAFFRDVRALGYAVARELRFRDHHRYTRRDLDGIVEAAMACGAACVLTTEKDFVRLLPFRPFVMAIDYLPSAIAIDPADDFDRWLRGVVEKGRA